VSPTLQNIITLPITLTYNGFDALVTIVTTIADKMKLFESGGFMFIENEPSISNDKPLEYVISQPPLKRQCSGLEEQSEREDINDLLGIKYIVEYLLSKISFLSGNDETSISSKASTLSSQISQDISTNKSIQLFINSIPKKKIEVKEIFSSFEMFTNWLSSLFTNQLIKEPPCDNTAAMDIATEVGMDTKGGGRRSRKRSKGKKSMGKQRRSLKRRR
jgi:hypothetical protein